MRCRGTLLALVCALLLAMPASALAQSAGDNQYQDPFSGQTQGGGNSGGGGSSGGGNAQASPQTAQAAPASPSATTSQGQQQPTGGASGTLPRTGFLTPLPLAYGLVLLLGGAALRRGARPRIR
jgi:hypothetical protein